MGPAYGAGSGRSASRTGVILDEEGKVLFWKAKVSAGSFPQQALDVVSA